MFENLIGQKGVRSQLSQLVKERKVPGVLLFTGEEYSGKMTAALELSRVLSCRKEGEWGCLCTSCAEQHLLHSSNLLLLGRRSFMEEINAAGELLKKERREVCRTLYIRNVRKLLKRFEPLLWEGQENKLAKGGNILGNLAESLESLEPPRPLPPEKVLEKTLRTMADHLRSLLAILPTSIPVDQIRNISRWTHRTSSDQARVVVLEGVDNLQDSAANGLLKILEEPPPQVYFILIARHKGRLLPTILSRARVYDFVPRTQEEVHSILQKLFHYQGPKRSLAQYFQDWSDLDYPLLESQVGRFLDLCLEGGSPYELEELFSHFEKSGAKEEFNAFLELLTGEMGRRFRGGDKWIGTVQGRELLKDLTGQVRDCSIKSKVYNQGSIYLLESLFFTMRERYAAFC